MIAFLLCVTESGKDKTCSAFRLRLLQGRGEDTSNDLYVYDLGAYPTESQAAD